MKITVENGIFIWQDSGGIVHREDGPAVIFPSGDEEWVQYGLYHREDGPAVVWDSGYNSWWYEGKCHRTDGPAVTYSDGKQEFWIHGERFTEDDFKIMSFAVYGKAVNT